MIGCATCYIIAKMTLKLEQISTNQSSMDLHQDSVSLIEFSPGPCFELEWISMSHSQVKLKNFFLKKNKSYQYQLKVLDDITTIKV